MKRHAPDGFNIGINVGEAAGQTVPHLHIHVIPRYRDDVPDPTGGVRNVIPERGNYLAGEPSMLHDAPHRTPLVTGETDPLFPHLLAHMQEASQVDVAVAFVLMSGVRRIVEHLRDVVSRGGSLRILTGDYLDVTDPAALRVLLDLANLGRDQVDVRIFETRGRSFHPKAYIFRDAHGRGLACVGSSNLTEPALGDGLEWNYRVISSRDQGGFGTVRNAFEDLFRHPSTRPLDHAWIDAYDRRREAVPVRPVEVVRETPEPPPTPHGVQQEALRALEETRAAGNGAGLVVLATGLGKTWLSAFDGNRPEFERILFVAHREEILSQAMSTYRRIRPHAHLGHYTGREKNPAATVIFASIQTLGRANHLRKFRPRDFDYIVVDEFHHAMARTYRKLIDYFEPKFLLGLTATPERTDGGNLMVLCGENLVYRCDLAEGIRRELLCPFHYYGVPDEVDYRNIPWRSSRFDPGDLTNALATEARARNALEQHAKRGGQRTLAFCSSTRHADFMARFFQEAGIESRAVHSDAMSAPRARSLEQLGEGTIRVVFAVDMFNEGVDLPNVDTIMMLRPTESRILWLQQLGRGLRRADDKPHLNVIDYIGNHRTFLLKPRTLFDLGPGDGAVAVALERLRTGRMDLPPGCEVTYELEAVDILKGLLRTKTADAIRAYYEDFRERTGVRPTAVELMHEGYNPRTVRKSHGSWIRFVHAQGDLEDRQGAAVEEAGSFLDDLEITPMARSYKMLVLLAMMNQDRFPEGIDLEHLVQGVRRICDRSARLRTDVGPAVEEPEKLEKHLAKNPIAAWAGGKGTRETYFTFEGSWLRTTLRVSPENRQAMLELTREIVDWRLAEYLLRSPEQIAANKEGRESRLQ